MSLRIAAYEGIFAYSGEDLNEIVAQPFFLEGGSFSTPSSQL